LPACLVLVVSLLAGCGGGEDSEEGNGGEGGGPPGPPPSKVRVGLVERATVQQKRLIVGSLEAVQRSVVAAEEAGRVVQPPPDRGTAVEQGAVLAKLDDELLRKERSVEQALKRQAEASVNEAEARYKQASKLVERYRALVEEGGVTRTQLDEAVRDMRVAEAQKATAGARVARHAAAIALIDERIERMTTEAPFGGQIVEKHAEVGQWLAAGGPVVSMVRVDKVDAVLNVPDHMIGEVGLETPVEVKVTSIDSRRSAPVYRIVRDADRRARTYPVVVRLENVDGVLKPGMMVEAELPTGRAVESLTVPRNAVHTTPSGIRVMVNRGGQAVPVPVNIRFKIGARFAVDATLEPGEQVVVEGNERLRPGDRLQVLNAEQVAEAAAPTETGEAGRSGSPSPTAEPESKASAG
jgi:RND family efflux transporter MFP subunit